MTKLGDSQNTATNAKRAPSFFELCTLELIISRESPAALSFSGDEIRGLLTKHENFIIFTATILNRMFWLYVFQRMRMRSCNKSKNDISAHAGEKIIEGEQQAWHACKLSEILKTKFY